MKLLRTRYHSWLLLSIICFMLNTSLHPLFHSATPVSSYEVCPELHRSGDAGHFHSSTFQYDEADWCCPLCHAGKIFAAPTGSEAIRLVTRMDYDPSILSDRPSSAFPPHPPARAPPQVFVVPSGTATTFLSIE